MSRSRMMNNDDAPAELPPVPTGIQRLLRLASVSAEFRRELIERRGRVADAADVPLTESERAILGVVPAALLDEMAEKMPPTSAPRRDFLRKTAATAVVLLGGAALGEGVAGCDKSDKADTPTHFDHNETHAAGGAAPQEVETDAGAKHEEPPIRPDYSEAPTGIAPDMPPEQPKPPEPPPRPTTKSVTRGIKPDMP